MIVIFRSGLGCYNDPRYTNHNEGWGEMAVRKFNNQGDMLYQMGFWGTEFTKSYDTCQSGDPHRVPPIFNESYTISTSGHWTFTPRLHTF
jgi:hypothetical protein